MPIDPESRAAALELVTLDPRAGDQELIAALCGAIRHPDQIDNTNRFASLLGDMGDERFIEPLVEMIARGVPSETVWLADYMYALIELLAERHDYYPAHEDFTHLLGGWLLNTRGGEISWKAGDILSEVECPASRKYLMKGAEDDSLFHLTRISCLRGIVNHFSDDARPLLAMLANDAIPQVRDACLSAMEHLDRVERRTQPDLP